MEILKKLLEVIINILNDLNQSKIERQEAKRIEIEQKKFVKELIEKKKNEIINPKKPDPDNFFDD